MQLFRDDKKGDKVVFMVIFLILQPYMKLNLATKPYFFLVFFFFWLFSFESFAQISFRDTLTLYNPVKRGSNTSFKDRISAHSTFLGKAKTNDDLRQQYFGLSYLYYDYFDQNLFIEAEKILLQAEKVANKLNDKSVYANWQEKKAVFSFAVHSRFDKAITHFRKAIELCAITGDSICMAEGLEQIGGMYKNLSKYDSAHYYYALAIPLLLKFGDKRNMAVTYNNYGNLLVDEGKKEEAKLYYEKAIGLAREIVDTYRVHLITNNLAHTYNQMGEYDTALKLYLDNIKFIKSRNWNDLLEYSYDGIIVSYEKKRDFENAYNYLELYHGLKDSLRGAKIQVEITELRSDFHAQNKELIYAREKQKLEIRNLVLAVVILLVLMVLILVLFLLRKKRKELAIHKAKLSQLTQLLISKNEALRQAYPIDDEQQIVDEEPNGMELDILNKRILTDEDWLIFKTQFEQAYPGYLMRVRNKYASITEAEERLFLFLKLKLTNKEAASILGISPDSVKKTKYRLKKRLEIGDEVSLDDFVQEF